MKSTLRLAVLAALGGMYTVPALAADAPATPPAPTSLLEAIQMGKPMTSFRLRYEHVDQEGIVPGVPTENLDNANAWTLRSLVGWQTAPFKNISIAAQFINVTQFNDDFYDGTDAVFGSHVVPYDRKKYATVADPDYTDINQLYLDWTGLPDTKFRLGRQSLKLDNVRFVGNVEFRQVMQVFDGLAIENKSIKDVELYAAHFEALTRINTERISKGNVDIAHATWKYTPTGNLTGYGYFQDMPYNGWNSCTDNKSPCTIGGTGFEDNSNQTYGLRVDGNHKINDDWKALYTAEYAKQDDYRDGDDRIDAHYWRAGAGVGWKSWYLRLDRELLSSNDGQYGFQTPLATGHLFQGWGDSFLLTPKQGMEDTFLSFGGKIFDIQLSGEYHWFKSDDDFRTAGDSATNFSGNNYGKELDLSAAYAYGKNWLGKIEYFHYTADDCYATDGNCSSTGTKRSYRDKDNFLITLQYTF